jgi:rhomboid protease GluP
MTNGAETVVRVTRDQKLAAEWELVLVAQGLSPTVRWSQEGIVLSVPEEQVTGALAGLAAYDNENLAKLQERDDLVESPNWIAGIAIAGLLLTFYGITMTWSPALAWFEGGSADANRIALGELWRTVTALTLHADIAHVAGNAGAIAVFLGVLFGMVGVGVGIALVLLAGAGGNYADALLYGSAHVSVGASTAVFGAIGMLGGLGLARRRRGAARKHRAWLSIGAALALLAMLGTGGERVDIGAHFFGFFLGGVLGGVVSLVAPPPPGRWVQWACGSAALGLLIYCWSLALR